MGYTPMSQQRFDSIYKKAIKEHVKRHSIVTLFEHFNHQ